MIMEWENSLKESIHYWQNRLRLTEGKKDPNRVEFIRRHIELLSEADMHLSQYPGLKQKRCMSDYRRWSKEDDNLLRSMLNVKTQREIAVILGRTVPSVKNRVKTLGLRCDRRYDPVVLSREDKLWLKLNYPHMRTSLCSVHLGISKSAVRKQARILGINKSEEFLRECSRFSGKKASQSPRWMGTHNLIDFKIRMGYMKTQDNKAI